MSKKFLPFSVVLGLATGIHAGEPIVEQLPPNIEHGEQLSDLPQVDLVQLGLSQTGEMDIDGNTGNLSVTTYELRSILSKPFALPGDITLVPMFTYTGTLLDFEDTGPFPLHDEDLHSLSLHLFGIKDFSGTSWFMGAWGRAELATDFQGIENDSFTFDTALGLGYKFSETLSVAVGAAATNINSDSEFYVGLNFDWKASDRLRFGIYGPNLLARYAVSDGWNISLRGNPGGGSWVYNDDLGRSRTIDLSSYQVGLYTENNIYGDFWLTAGGGFTFGNEIEVRNNHGANSFSRDMDGAAFARVMLGLRSW